MWDKYVVWAKIIYDEGDAGGNIDAKPDYLSEHYFLTSDAKHKKFYAKGISTGKNF